MLQLRPNCECCGKTLAPDSVDARICSFECTFCASCAETPLKGRCPNCGGELVARLGARRINSRNIRAPRKGWFGPMAALRWSNERMARTAKHRVPGTGVGAAGAHAGRQVS
jgi:hypothetical protein